MNAPLEVVQRYFDAWNSRNGPAIVEVFAIRGSYEDPNGVYVGQDIADYAAELWSAFPDLEFEILSLTESGDHTVMAQWRMRGTNGGSFNGLPPTGKSVSLDGVYLIQMEDDRIVSIAGYFDSMVIPKQLGLQLLVQPDQLGAFSFGYSVSTHTGKTCQPGAFSITSIWHNEEESDEFRNRSRQVSQQLRNADGFIGMTFARSNGRGITITAWEHPDDVTRAITHASEHGEAMRRFWDELGDAGYTSIWAPLRINPMYVRCRGCNNMADYYRGEGTCTCGEKLPDPPPYF